MFSHIEELVFKRGLGEWGYLRKFQQTYYTIQVMSDNSPISRHI